MRSVFERWRFGAAVVTLLLLLGGCSEILSEPYEYGTIEVIAQRSGGEPVPGVHLTLFTGTRHLAYGTTGDDGRFLFEFVPGSDLGVYAVPPEGYQTLDGTGGYISTTGFDEADHRVMEFTYMKNGVGTVRVTVRDGQDQGVEGANLVLRNVTGSTSEVTTGPDGSFAFERVASGFYNVFLFPPAGYFLPDQATSAVTRELIIDDGRHEDVSFVLIRCEGRMHALVRSAGRPVEGAALSLYSPDGVLANVRTGDDGRYDFGTLPCRADYGLKVFPPDGYTVEDVRGSSYFDGIAVGHESDVEIEFDLTATAAAPAS